MSAEPLTNPESSYLSDTPLPAFSAGGLLVADMVTIIDEVGA